MALMPCSRAKFTVTDVQDRVQVPHFIKIIFFLGNYLASGWNLKTNVSGLTVCPIKVENLTSTSFITCYRHVPVSESSSSGTNGISRGFAYIHIHTYIHLDIDQPRVWMCRSTLRQSSGLITSNTDLIFTLQRSMVTLSTTRFNIKKSLRSAHTVYLCGSENKQRLFHYTALTDWFL
jgi:hypothetical protein